MTKDMAGKERRTIIVTGAAGFIGAALCERLAFLDYEVLGIDNLNNYYDRDLKFGRLEKLGFLREYSKQKGALLKSPSLPSLYFENADITERRNMSRIFRQWHPEVVVNLAAQAGVRYSLQNPYSYTKNNVDGFLVMLECARQHPLRRFVYASSSSVYGENTKVPFSETDPVEEPVSLYAATKRSNELMARTYRHLYGVPAIGLRFFTVYGPWGRPDMAPMLFASAISEGRPINVFNDGHMSRDFTYIDDIINGIVKVIEGDSEVTSDNDILNIGHGSPTSLLDFISILEKALGKEARKEFLPMQKGDVHTTFADTGRLERLYGYRPATELKDGIARFVEWFKEYKL